MMKKNKKWNLIDIKNLELNLFNDAKVSFTYKHTPISTIIKKCYRMNSVPVNIIIECSTDTDRKMDVEFINRIENNYNSVLKKINKKKNGEAKNNKSKNIL